MQISSVNYRQLVENDRISGRVYYDAAIFREELEKIWTREWIYVAHESEVPKPGDYVTRQIGLQPVIVSRDEAARSICCSIDACIAAIRYARAIAATRMPFDAPITVGPTTIAATW